LIRDGQLREETMAKEIIMPKNGMDMKEGVLVRWLKEVGDRVERGDPIMEIETDKVTMESESPAAGVILARYFEEGAVIPVLTVMGYIGEEGESVPCGPDTDRPGASVAPSAGRETSGAPTAGLSAPAASYDYDLAVIGGGPAGYVGAIRAAQLGGKVILFERDTVGGTCLNRGCIPTKTYLKTAEYLYDIRHAHLRGILNDGDASVNLPGAVRYKDEVVGKLTSGVAGLLKSYKVTTVYGDAAPAGAHEVVSGERTFSAAGMMLCGGSVPAAPPIPGIGHSGVWTSDDILSATELPRRLCILGGGVIGCEIACAFSAFGSDVTIVEMLPRLVANMDSSLSELIERSLSGNGVRVITGTAVCAIESADGLPVLVVDDSRIECDKVLVATGRVPDLSCLGALKHDIETGNGAIKVDDAMRTSVEGVYAAGDVTGRVMLAHAAFRMAETAAENAMGGHRSCDLKYTPSCIYTSPEAASVGLTEDAARERYGDSVSVGRFPFAANGRALASGAPAGFVKVIIDRTCGEILGTHIAGAAATEMIAEPAALMSMEITAHEAAEDIIHAHPTYAEAFAEACADALGRCVHLPPNGPCDT
jgi:dihydrolipoamide dehydrogenase